MTLQITLGRFPPIMVEELHPQTVVFRFDKPSPHIYMHGTPTDQNAVDLTSATRDRWFHYHISKNYRFNLSGKQCNTVFENPPDFAMCIIPRNTALQNKNRMIFISTRPVLTKSVYYDHISRNYGVFDNGQNYVMFEMRESGMHFLYKCLSYKRVWDPHTGETLLQVLQHAQN